MVALIPASPAFAAEADNYEALRRKHPFKWSSTNPQACIQA